MDVTSAATAAPRAPYARITDPGPEPGVDVTRSADGLAAPGPGAAPAPTPVPTPKAWVAWFDLNGDGHIQNFPVSEGGDAYLPGAVDFGRRSVPVERPRPEPAPRLEVPGDRSDDRADDPAIVDARLQRAAEVYLRDGGGADETEGPAKSPTVVDRISALIHTVEEQVVSAPADRPADPAPTTRPA